MNVPDPSTTEPVLVTLQETRRLTGLGATTIWKLIQDGRLKSVLIGKRRLVEYASIRRLAA